VSGGKKSSGDELMSEVVLEIDGPLKGWRRYCSECMWGKGVSRAVKLAMEREKTKNNKECNKGKRQKTKDNRNAQLSARDTHHVMPEYKRDPIRPAFVFFSLRRCLLGK
jgi:hypothetical protein